MSLWKSCHAPSSQSVFQFLTMCWNWLPTCTKDTNTEAYQLTVLHSTQVGVSKTGIPPNPTKSCRLCWWILTLSRFLWTLSSQQHREKITQLLWRKEHRAAKAVSAGCWAHSSPAAQSLSARCHAHGRGCTDIADPARSHWEDLDFWKNTEEKWRLCQ